MRNPAYPVAVLFLAACLLLFGTPAAGAESAPVSAVMDDAEWQSIDHTHCRFTDKQQLLDEVTACAAAIAALTERDDWTDFYGPGGVTIEIALADMDTPSHVEGAYESYAVKIPKLYINRFQAEYNFWTLAHELTHLMFPYYSSLSLREGLACAMQDTVGKNPAAFNYGLDAHAYAYLLLAEHPDVLSLMGSGDFRKSASVATSGKRAVFYVCSYSFSKYLIETYGMDAFMALYETGNIEKTCRLLFQRDMARLVDDWTRFLHAYPAKQTQAELDQALKDIIELHGVPTNP